MATFLDERGSLLRAAQRLGLRGLLEARKRRRLARAVRRRAREEREHCHRGAVIEFASVAARTALYERIAEHLEDVDRPVAALGVGRLERLLAEAPPIRDYGPRAGARNARIASILAELERAGSTCERSRAGRELPSDGRSPAPFWSDRQGRAGK